MVEIKGIEKFAPKDFPGFVSATFFVGGCNFRCPFCHNADLVIRPDSLADFPMDYVLAFLDSRAGWLEGICITGGEPLLHADIDVLLQVIKDRDLLVKIDTNGTAPDLLNRLIAGRLVDHIAMDIKSTPEKYEKAAGVAVDMKTIRRCIDIILESGLPHTFRTTAVPGLVHKEDIAAIAELLKGARVFQLQQFYPEGALDAAYRKMEPYTPEIFLEMAAEAKMFFEEVRTEGVSP
ncbi:MAG: anaerobic ribonucleoside-triphosphate reductase activating protein [Acidobacteria bacterium]|nr:anaerobic ribonucleoside-triphosphate reductase activating protein [Acidobacteriota bacterium]MBU4253669.1 anaerobic ribonucleoside-triphosphate reductase activating protein [Acidobacteriota bacterium]